MLFCRVEDLCAARLDNEWRTYGIPKPCLTLIDLLERCVMTRLCSGSSDFAALFFFSDFLLSNLQFSFSLLLAPPDACNTAPSSKTALCLRTALQPKRSARCVCSNNCKYSVSKWNRPLMVCGLIVTSSPASKLHGPKRDERLIYQMLQAELAAGADPSSGWPAGQYGRKEDRRYHQRGRRCHGQVDAE